MLLFVVKAFKDLDQSSKEQSFILFLKIKQQRCFFFLGERLKQLSSIVVVLTRSGCARVQLTDKEAKDGMCQREVDGARCEKQDRVNRELPMSSEALCAV